MKTLLRVTVMIVALLVIITECRYIRDRERGDCGDCTHDIHNMKESRTKTFDRTEYSEEAIDVVKAMMTPYRFAPLNRDYVFKMDVPCKEGFKRDVMGICREVWD